MILTQAKITIVIPVVNEAQLIGETISQLLQHPTVETIFVDGGSQDNTVSLIQESGLKVILSPIMRRSSQMNLGAKEAQGDILLFLHGDTTLPDNFAAIITQTVTQHNFVAGAFALKIDNPQNIFRILENLIQWRSTFLSLPYGDQAIFLRKEQFDSLNGFDELVIMEDFALIKKLQKIGKIYIAPEKVTTSDRRWRSLGLWKTTLINQLMIIGYYLGVENQILANFYRRITNK